MCNFLRVGAYMDVTADDDLILLNEMYTPDYI
jgi:hypothetical protein